MTDQKNKRAMKNQRVFIYGFDEYAAQLAKDFYGRDVDVVDVTPQYQDILALCADVVIVNTDYAPKEVISSVREFEKEAEDPSVEYYYCSGNEIVNLFQTH